MINEHCNLSYNNRYFCDINQLTLSRLMSSKKDNDDLLAKILLSLSFFFLFRIVKWMFNKGWFNRYL